MHHISHITSQHGASPFYSLSIVHLLQQCTSYIQSHLQTSGAPPEWRVEKGRVNEQGYFSSARFSRVEVDFISDPPIHHHLQANPSRRFHILAKSHVVFIILEPGKISRGKGGPTVGLCSTADADGVGNLTNFLLGRRKNAPQRLLPRPARLAGSWEHGGSFSPPLRVADAHSQLNVVSHNSIAYGLHHLVPRRSSQRGGQLDGSLSERFPRRQRRQLGSKNVLWKSVISAWKPSRPARVAVFAG
ncbi:hypothetical protein B0T10DRAFT_454826 [Thelonectria olida]|uniref:Uncharacterized protein n=1 Tax=Thelonectria olida TaxID=1576542 RepID=A0A9P8WDI6_9HYPO|nr:hypothetical protein B0T10DRAFT_454826 [Thelonectria olida]